MSAPAAGKLKDAMHHPVDKLSEFLETIAQSEDNSRPRRAMTVIWLRQAVEKAKILEVAAASESSALAELRAMVAERIRQIEVERSIYEPLIHQKRGGEEATTIVGLYNTKLDELRPIISRIDALKAKKG